MSVGQQTSTDRSAPLRSTSPETVKVQGAALAANVLDRAPVQAPATGVPVPAAPLPTP